MQKSVIVVLLFMSASMYGQDLAFGKKIVDTLSSSFFWGRGYTNDGMKKAAAFLTNQFTQMGLQPAKGKNFEQSFSYSVNTFPGEMRVFINDKELMPGKDYIVSPDSRGVKATGTLLPSDSIHFIDARSRVIVSLEDKLTWSVAPLAQNYTIINVDKKALGGVPKSFSVQIENKWIKKFDAVNVVGMVKGTAKPDSFIVCTAHYDHLGGMGKDIYFPGANDNASGIALLLNLARYYSKNPARYSMVFIGFAGEEAGLIGSKYFTENPLIPLKNIRFLLNTDLAGTGEEGITVVNATEFPKEFGWMQEMNKENNLLAAINARGKAANSDHYFFSEKGVPAFFFYTLGGIKAYHDVFDKAATLPLNEHEDLFKLMVLLVGKLTGSD
jgi:aminopeptidase YwaD